LPRLAAIVASISTGISILIDALATGGLERRHLGGGVLIIGGDSGVADLRCSNVSPFNLIMQYLFATLEPRETQTMPLRCKTARLCNARQAGVPKGVLYATGSYCVRVADET
jgi:hypothetical protein